MFALYLSAYIITQLFLKASPAMSPGLGLRVPERRMSPGSGENKGKLWVISKGQVHLPEVAQGPRGSVFSPLQQFLSFVILGEAKFPFTWELSHTIKTADT